MRVPDVRGTDAYRLGLHGRQVASYGYRYVLPVRFSYRAYAEDGFDKLRYSFLSLDRSTEPPARHHSSLVEEGEQRLSRNPVRGEAQSKNERFIENTQRRWGCSLTDQNRSVDGQ